MIENFALSSANNIAQHFQQHIIPFWQEQVITSQFIGQQEINIAFAYCLAPNAKACIVISPGRTEGYLKYQELIYDLYNNGYSVFVIDHRGQGLSGRLINHKQKGHVEKFQYYVDDFAQFCQEQVLPKANAPLCLLGHSMGAAIATLYLQQNHVPFIASAMSAPLYGFNSGVVPMFIAKPLSQLLIAIKTITGGSSDYFLGQFDYRDAPFRGNKLTHCEARYQQFRQLYEHYSELRLGGITFHWLATSLQAIKQLFNQLDQISTPILLIQAYDDEIVNLNDQCKFYNRLALRGLCEKIELHGAKHEIFFETDLMRTTAITKMLNFFNQHLVTSPSQDNESLLAIHH